MSSGSCINTESTTAQDAVTQDETYIDLWRQGSQSSPQQT